MGLLWFLSITAKKEESIRRYPFLTHAKNYPLQLTNASQLDNGKVEREVIGLRRPNNGTAGYLNRPAKN
jgi:hypothetical protein